ncbi:MAG: RecQ family ATP-dependent DNA helicase [Gammaproteobacteria bacterium]
MDCSVFLQRVCSVDLESNENGEVFALGAAFGSETLLRKAPFTLGRVLAELHEFAADAAYLLGHNLLRHDLPICRALAPDAKVLTKPAVDTLFLSPLAFPENPYHRLVKDYKLVRDALNDPLADARLAVRLFRDQWQALSAQQQDSGVLDFYRYAFAGDAQYAGVRAALEAMGARRIGASSAFDLFKTLCDGKVCRTAFHTSALSYLPDPDKRPALAYCLAWLRVAGGNSVLPPWVRLQFPEVGALLAQLRDIRCAKPDCAYCSEIHDPVGQLQRFFGFAAFRAEPQADDGSSLQHAIVSAAMADKPLFAVLPTGGGKSLCYQLPALVRYQRRGVLTIVISPLQALMKDQVDNLRIKTGAPHAAALYGLLTSPERGAVLDGIRMGDVALLYVSPEQLRNRSFQNAVAYREIGCWVFDEAHCLSKWGHDFRPDYLYAGRFIKEFAARQNSLLPPVQCFTATAKQDVRDEIIDYFRANLGQELQVFEGGVERGNLHFAVQTVNRAEKFGRIHELLQQHYAGNENGGSVIVYCATQKRSEEVADYLQQQGWQAEAFHAGKNPAEKKHVQENFIAGTTRVIAATNAFGMGIDKEDVRLVIHADIPGSLENYMQEAGRAGRDQHDADCVLLYDEQDIETQFKLSALSEVGQRDIAQILRGLRRYKKDRRGNTVLTGGELLMQDDVDVSFSGDDYNAATKVITAIAWLERAGFVRRHENRTQVFQGRPLVKDRDEAKGKIAALGLSQRQQQRWLAILEALFNADSDEGFSADALALHGAFAEDPQETVQGRCETAGQRVIRTLYDMAAAGLIKKQLLMSAYVRYKVANASQELLHQICALERAMLDRMREQAPDAGGEEWQQLSLRHLNQALLDAGYANSNPEVLRNLLFGLSRDGKGLAGGKGSLHVRHRGLDRYLLKLLRDWPALVKTAELRRAVAAAALQAIIARIPPDAPAAADCLVEFAVEDLHAALQQDMLLSAEIKDPLAAIERALNFLHEQRVITLQKGLAVFRQAMTIEVLPEAKGRRYGKGDYEPLAQHYGERTFQVHVINEYARRALDRVSQALAFVLAYFALDKSEFVRRYFADRKEILLRATSRQSFQRIVGDLHNPEQIALVAAPEEDNALILAGPGSGKTRVVVHRVAYLLRVKRVDPRSILVLCFNRNAVTELRRRLQDLVGDDAKGVTVQTYHGLSLRLTGHAFGTRKLETDDGDLFAGMVEAATALLRGEKPLLGLEADAARERLLAGYRFILVDEYQDIDAAQYRLIAAIAGRYTDDENKLAIFAVGDDDQTIYQFRGANAAFIRRFEQDYQARCYYLVENYRSSAPIIAAANALIAHNRDRLKIGHPIRINTGRNSLAPGGRWNTIDPMAQGRVQIIRCRDADEQAAACIAELQRLKQLDSRFEWTQCAVLAKEWRLLAAVRAGLAAENIPVGIMLPREGQPPPFRIRENLLLLETMRQSGQSLSNAAQWLEFVAGQLRQAPNNPWWQQLQAMLRDWQSETGGGKVPTAQTLEFLYETLAEQGRERRLGQGVLLGTIHSIKGMEFGHVFILDGGWGGQDREEQRRLLYVAMTRAKETLCLLQRGDRRNPFLKEIDGDFVLRRDAPETSSPAPGKQKHYAVLGMQDFYLSYAARFPETAAVHRCLAQLQTGDRLELQRDGDKIAVKLGPVTVAMLSQHAGAEWRNKLDTIETVTVIALVRRYRDDGGDEYRDACRVGEWEVPLLEVVYIL